MGLNPLCLVTYKKMKIWMEKDDVNTQGDDSHLQAKKTAGTDSYSQLLKGTSPAGTMISDSNFQNCEEIDFHGLNPLVYGTLRGQL